MFEDLLGPVGIFHKEGNHRIGHHPPPVELPASVPGRFVDMVYPRCQGLVLEGFISPVPTPAKNVGNCRPALGPVLRNDISDCL